MNTMRGGKGPYNGVRVQTWVKPPTGVPPRIAARVLLLKRRADEAQNYNVKAVIHETLHIKEA